MLIVNMAAGKLFLGFVLFFYLLCFFLGFGDLLSAFYCFGCFMVLLRGSLKFTKIMKTILQAIGMLIWILGGGALLACIFIGLPFLVIVYGISLLGWLWNYWVFEVIAFVVVGLLLIYGFTEKVNNPLK